MNEFAWIARYFKPLSSGEAGSLGLADDVATLTPPAGHSLVITTDSIHEGVHFLPDTNPALVARKALRVNLSDLAAKGVKPHAYTLALSLSNNCGESWIASFSQGLAQDQALFGCHLVGGDTTHTLGPLSITITLFGFAKHSDMLLRSGAHVDDIIYVSGSIGDAALGLQLLQNPPTILPSYAALAIERYHLPQPRTALGQSLVGIASSSMDISDGLVQDLEHLSRASGVGADIHLSHIPMLGGDALTEQERVERATAGDDYELLFTASKAQADQIGSVAAAQGITITAIGQITPQSEVRVLNRDGREIHLTRKGYQHL